MKIIIQLITLMVLVFIALPSFATKPCFPQSYASNYKRSSAEWIKKATWAAKVEVTEVTHKWQPYPNCSLKDRSQCAQQDVGRFKAKIIKALKGEIKGTRFNFKPAYCAKTIPEKKGVYIFYGLTSKYYDGYFKEKGK